jgi:hypothetical protein
MARGEGRGYLRGMPNTRITTLASLIVQTGLAPVVGYLAWAIPRSEQVPLIVLRIEGTWCFGWGIFCAVRLVILFRGRHPRGS